jgi:hypothetical protein
MIRFKLSKELDNKAAVMEMVGVWLERLLNFLNLTKLDHGLERHRIIDNVVG